MQAVASTFLASRAALADGLVCCAQSESDSDCPSRQRCSASRHASLPQHTKRLRGRHGGKAQRAHALFWPMAELPSAPLAEAEELVLESSFPRGLASAECFEARAPGAYLRARPATCFQLHLLLYAVSLPVLSDAFTGGGLFMGALAKLWRCYGVRELCWRLCGLPLCSSMAASRRLH